MNTKRYVYPSFQGASNGNAELNTFFASKRRRTTPINSYDFFTPDPLAERVITREAVAE